MKHKHIISLIIATLLLFSTGCESSRPASQKTAGGEAVLSDTAFDKINEALEEKKITEQEAVLLTLQAAFQPDKLPDKYLGADLPERYGVNADLQWVHDNWDTLDEASQKLFLPYYLPPDDPASIFNPASRSLKRSSFLSSGTIGSWKVEDITPTGSTTNVMINYYLSDSATQEDKTWIAENIAVVKEALNIAWPKYKKLLGVEPTKNFNLYLGDINKLAQLHGVSDKKLVGVHGFAIWDDKYQTCLVGIEESLFGDQLRGAVVHELFHCFQFYMGLTFYKGYSQLIWLMEATATWAEDLAYKDKNTEQDHLDTFFNTLQYRRIFANGSHEYASYLLFYFLSQRLGNNEHVRKALDDADWEAIPKIVMSSVSDFADLYSEFALYNWNQEPWRMYKDTPAFPGDKKPGKDAVLEFKEEEPEVTEYFLNLGEGSIMYMHHFFNKDTDKMKKVIFDFHTMNIGGYVRRQALIKIGGTWINADWNELEKREFCRGNDSENVSEVIVIFSNADMSNPASMSYTVDTTRECEILKKGYIKITQTLEIEGDYFSEAVYESNEDIEYVYDEDFDGLSYKIMRQDATFKYRKTAKVEIVEDQFMTEVTDGSGKLTESYVEDDDDKKPVRFVINRDDSIRLNTGYTSYKSREWVKYSHSLTSAGKTTSYSEDGEPLFQEYGFMQFELNEDEIFEDKIRGSRTFYLDGSTGSLKTVVEFEYDLP